MDFLNYPQRLHQFRNDSGCTVKGEDGQCASIQIQKGLNFASLRVKLTLKTNEEHLHFNLLGNLKTKSFLNRELILPVKNNQEIIKLDFFTIKKVSKKEALKYISGIFHNKEEIYTQNASSIILNLQLIDEKQRMLCYIRHELRLGNTGEDRLTILSVSPRTLYDEGEITFALRNKIKGDNLPKLSIQSECFKKEYKCFNNPAPTVLVYKVNIHEIKDPRFQGRLIAEDINSEIQHFTIRPSLVESFKMKEEEEFSTSSSKSINDLKTVKFTRTIDPNNQSNTNLKQLIANNIVRKHIQDENKNIQKNSKDMYLNDFKKTKHLKNQKRKTNVVISSTLNGYHRYSQNKNNGSDVEAVNNLEIFEHHLDLIDLNNEFFPEVINGNIKDPFILFNSLEQNCSPLSFNGKCSNIGDMGEIAESNDSEILDNNLNSNDPVLSEFSDEEFLKLLLDE